MQPAKNKFTIFKQIVGIIPAYLVPKLATEHDVDRRCRTFSAWSHTISMIFAHLTHALSLNDICDTLRLHQGVLSTMRNATAPSRNGLSHANRVRPASMARALFYQVLRHLTNSFPRFGRMDEAFKLPRKLKRTINLVDSTTIQLFANCMSWAKHRRRKAAAKCHMLLDAQTFLPRVAVIGSAACHDAVAAKTLCSTLRDGEFVVFDKAYIDFAHLYALKERGVLWVNRAKSNMTYRIVKIVKRNFRNIILDARIRLTGHKSSTAYPEAFRLIIADVVRDGKVVRMEFITDEFELAAATICDLYKARWDIEIFFRQIKQTLKLSDFLGYNENAVQWQIWMALLTYVLLRFIAYTTKWKGTFARLFTVLRGILWSRLTCDGVSKFCGTAEDQPRMCMQPQQLYLAIL